MDANLLLYEATYVRKGGSILPYGAKVQFVSDRYSISALYFDSGNLSDRNFKKEISEAYLRVFGKNVENEISECNHFFEIKCLSLEEYKNKNEERKKKIVNTQATYSHKRKWSCLGCLVKIILLLIAIFFAVVAFGWLLTKLGY